MDDTFWDSKYRAQDKLWSGNANGVLVAETSSLPPGRALDVGCGEGADARWLAERGWQVTGVDVSQVALDRAAAVSGDLPVRWVRLDLATNAPAGGSYDLVSAQYFPLPRSEGDPAARGLLDAVAAGGTLLVAGHDLSEMPAHTEDGVDPADYYRPDEVAALLDDAWTVVINETRPRVGSAASSSQHTRDAVLLAHRRP